MKISMILILIALFCDLVGFIRPSWSLENVAIIFICIALLIRDATAGKL